MNIIGGMATLCRFEVSAPVSRTVYKTKDSGKAYWQLFIRLEDGELCFYVHDPDLQVIVENLDLGTEVIVRGEIHPHKQYSQTERPHFLSPLSITVDSE